MYINVWTDLKKKKNLMNVCRPSLWISYKFLDCCPLSRCNWEIINKSAYCNVKYWVWGLFLWVDDKAVENLDKHKDKSKKTAEGAAL